MLAQVLEYKPALPQTAHAVCVAALVEYRELVRPQAQGPAELIRTLAGLI